MQLYSSQPNKLQAFPLYIPGANDREQPAEPDMTMRDYLAAQALSALIQVIPSGSLAKDTTYASIAQSAYKLADAMLKARKL